MAGNPRDERIRTLSMEGDIPLLLKKIVMIETRAAPTLKTVEGLWRSSTKKRPGRMTDYIRSQNLLTNEEIDSVITNTPTEPLFKEDIENWQHLRRNLWRKMVP